MALTNKATSDLLSIVKAGGSLDFDASKKATSDLTLIAKAAAVSGATVYLRNVSGKATSDLVSIAKGGEGRVVFCD